jgi:hypothetical protein
VDRGRGKQKSPRNLRNESEGFRSLASRIGQWGGVGVSGWLVDWMWGVAGGFAIPLDPIQNGRGRGWGAGIGRAGAGTALEVVLRRLRPSIPLMGLGEPLTWARIPQTTALN